MEYFSQRRLNLLIDIMLLFVTIHSKKEKHKFVDTVKLYSTLNFEVIKNSPLWIWDEQMEFRYWEKLITWNEKPLKVIIVPFSHNDAAWLQTFEEYYERKTKRILDNIVNILPEMSSMTFVWSEICFLQHWWDRTTEHARNTFKHLVKIGKLEIIGGGWVMPDEATTHVFSLCNQLIEGHQWIWENLEIVPEYAWSIDPFGCSSVMAYLLAISGTNGLVIQRIHYSWKRFFSEEGSLDAIWKQDFEAPVMKLRIQQNPGYTVTDSCGPALNLCSDYDFNWDTVDCSEHITFGNIRKKSEILLGLYGRIGSLTNFNTVLITLGGDFRFENESEWLQQYRNYKAIIDYINSVKSYNAQINFGTLKDFFDQIPEYNLTVKGDFFPYADLNHDQSLAYWTGYYSTRPYWKKLGRSLESLLRSTEILYTFAFNAKEFSSNNSKPLVTLGSRYKKLIRARRITALFQHHDGITGTAKARVMEDYKSKMIKSIQELKSIQKACIELMLQTDNNVTTKNEKLLKKVIVFNSLPYNRTEAIIIKTDYPSLLVIDSKMNQIHSQVNCVFNNKISFDSKECCSDKYELIFIDYLLPFSINTYEIHSIDSEFNRDAYINWDGKRNKVEGLSIVNNKQTITFSANGLINKITKDFGSMSISTNVKAYISEPGNSGAYLFKPLREKINIFSETREGEELFIDGSLFKETRVFYAKGYSISTRLYGSNSYLDELIEMKIHYNISESNRELFLEFITELKNTKFYTDVNSFHMRERVRNPFQHVEGNYYPITSLAYIENTEYRFSIICDHSHGAASIEDGSIEVMLDRRIYADDNRGLEEGLEDHLKTSSTFYILFQKCDKISKQLLHLLSNQLNNPPPIVVTEAGVSSESINLMNRPLPHNINFLNFMVLSKFDSPTPTALMILQNYGVYNSSETFLRDAKLKYLTIKSIFKTSLTGLKDEDELDELHDIKIKPFHILSLKFFFKV